MRFVRAFGGQGGAPGQYIRRAPGQFNWPSGVAVVRGLLVVSDRDGNGDGKRLQVLTPKGVPLQVLTLGTSLRRLCADEQRVWVADYGLDVVHVLKVA